LNRPHQTGATRSSPSQFDLARPTGRLANRFFASVALGSFRMGLHLTLVLGMVGTLATALAFFPPKAYTELIERGSAANREPATEG
jgi:hypothetical protein